MREVVLFILLLPVNKFHAFLSSPFLSILRCLMFLLFRIDLKSSSNLEIRLKSNGYHGFPISFYW